LASWAPSLRVQAAGNSLPSHCGKGYPQVLAEGPLTVHRSFTPFGHKDEKQVVQLLHPAGVLLLISFEKETLSSNRAATWQYEGQQGFSSNTSGKAALVTKLAANALFVPLFLENNGNNLTQLLES